MLKEDVMSAIQSSGPEQRDENLKLLEAAFARFNETGERLEAQYQALLQETEDLRSQLREKEKEIQRAEKLATLGETAAAIAHEVRNPLGAIKLFLSLLRRDVESVPSAVSLVDQIDTSIGSIDHVVENILQFSRDKNLSFGPINAHAVILEVIEILRPRGGQSGIIECHLDGNPFIVANEVALRQITHNLVLNGLQATRFSGFITVAFTDGENDTVNLVVSDNGPGIPEAICSTIFDPFVTTKNEGTGLGLAIVHQLVTQHGGTVRVQNDAGAQFTVVLPRTAHHGKNENFKCRTPHWS